MALQRGSYINLTEPRSKKKRRVDNSDWRPWSDLPEALLDLIMQLLGAIDYLMFGCVCKGWRLCVAAYKQEFMAFHPPLFIFLSRNAKRACYFYRIFDHRSTDISWTVYDSRDKFIGFCEPIPSIVDGVVFKDGMGEDAKLWRSSFVFGSYKGFWMLQRNHLER
nr:hypothetical protein CFP56_74105 [Quercus suber]